MTFNQMICISLLFSTFLFGCASKPRGQAFNANEAVTEADKARIIIYKDDTFYGSGYSWLITEDMNALAILSTNTYLVYDSEPKTVTLKSDLRISPHYLHISPFSAFMDTIQAVKAQKINSTIKLEELHSFQVSPGNIYYFRLEVDIDVVNPPKPFLVAVKEKEALQEMEGSHLALLAK
tara:strand:- start:425 stop:961 length:537 start_codon:yes stop_codon:yes gene_type:complete